MNTTQPAPASSTPRRGLRHGPARVVGAAVAVASFLILGSRSFVLAHGLDGYKQDNTNDLCTVIYFTGSASTGWVRVSQVISAAFQNESYTTGLSTSWRHEPDSFNNHNGNVLLFQRQERWHNTAVFGEPPISTRASVSPNSDAVYGNMKIWSNDCK